MQVRRADGGRRMLRKVTVVGAGLAGAEAAIYLSSHGFEVDLYEQKPKYFSPAHKSSDFAELVCSNSLKSDDVYGNACGLLKEEMRRLGSVTMEAAEVSRVPAGGALAVEREKFSSYITQKINTCPKIHLICEKIERLPEEGIVATGPLTDGELFEDIQRKIGPFLHFFDASAPIVSAESIDMGHVFFGDRYGKGTGDYLNCPLTKEEYEQFVEELLAAERARLHDFEVFEGCMPVEIMASRGKDTLRFGTFKPVGLAPFGAERPYAVLQLRKENLQGTGYGLVGCQTNLKFSEQKRVFSIIPALKNAEFLRYGVMHRNTYLQSPEILNADFSVKSNPMLYFAGQITGVEGYVESAMSGLFAAIHLANKLSGREVPPPEDTCVSGALSRYVASPNAHFEPMNANYGILRPLEERDKRERRRLIAVRALVEIENFKARSV